MVSKKSKGLIGIVLLGGAGFFLLKPLGEQTTTSGGGGGGLSRLFGQDAPIGLSKNGTSSTPATTNIFSDLFGTGGVTDQTTPLKQTAPIATQQSNPFQISSKKSNRIVGSSELFFGGGGGTVLRDLKGNILGVEDEGLLQSRLATPEERRINAPISQVNQSFPSSGGGSSRPRTTKKVSTPAPKSFRSGGRDVTEREFNDIVKKQKRLKR